MTKSKIMDIVSLTRDGWRPYETSINNPIYKRLGCEIVLKKRRGKPFWFTRENIFCCIGCSSNCTLVNPPEFPVLLPLPYPPVQRREFSITPKEMLERHDLLNVRQAAYCLNVSERTIYNMIAEGRLVRLKEQPVRVRAKEVKELRENFDE